MSILESILKTMYIDPELLAELSEDQKQLLFCKMREEQVRRWSETEKKLEAEEAKKKNKKSKKPSLKHVTFLHGSDDKEWVWIMGEHPKDKRIEQILEDEAKAKAAKQAELDAIKLREKEEEEIKNQLKIEEERLKKEKLEKELIAKKKAEEAALYQSLKEARLFAAKLEEEKKKLELKEKEELARLEKVRRSQTINTLEVLKSQRENDLYQTWKNLRRSIEKETIESSDKVEKEWMEQEKKSREAERKIRDLARKARAEHRRSIRSLIIDGTQPADYNSKTTAPPPPIPVKMGKEVSNKVNQKVSAPRPPRPTSKDSIIRWFRDEEMPKGTEKSDSTGQPEVWFHGIISRLEAEDLLACSSVGAFLVRVSEKIWGYTLTYKEESRCKHFLIDATDGKYYFFGTDHMKHATLRDLVNHHKNVPISLEHELLLHPCGQKTDPPDYQELYNNRRSEITAF